jgi:hypothetical protein
MEGRSVKSRTPTSTPRMGGDMKRSRGNHGPAGSRDADIAGVVRVQLLALVVQEGG